MFEEMVCGGITDYAPNLLIICSIRPKRTMVFLFSEYASCSIYLRHKYSKRKRPVFASVYMVRFNSPRPLKYSLYVSTLMLSVFPTKLSQCLVKVARAKLQVWYLTGVDLSVSFEKRKFWGKV